MTDPTGQALRANAVPMRYDMEKDLSVPVTQDWVNMVSNQVQLFGMAREASRKAIQAHKDFLNSWSPPGGPQERASDPLRGTKEPT